MGERRLARLGLELAATVAIGLTGVACGAARAEAELPTLEIPEPPPRVVTAGPPEDTSASPTPVDAPDTLDAEATRPATPPAPATATNAASPPTASAPTDAGGAAPGSPARLRSGNATEGAALATEVRDLLRRATRSLGSLDRRRLSAADRTQYDTAQRFVEQAEAALAGDNLVFARFLAEKGATLAGQLAGR